MYIYRKQPAVNSIGYMNSPLSGLGALAGIGNYTFSVFGAADNDTSIVLEPEQSADVEILPQVVVVPETPAPDTEQPPLEPPVETPTELTEAEIDQKIFGYFGSMPVSVGVQVMTIASGVAISLIAFLLGMKLGNSTRVSTKEVLLASAVASASAFAGVFAIRTFR